MGDFHREYNCKKKKQKVCAGMKLNLLSFLSIEQEHTVCTFDIVPVENEARSNYDHKQDDESHSDCGIANNYDKKRRTIVKRSSHIL